MDEEVADPDAQGLSHIEVLYRDVEVVGIAREEVENFQPTPVLMACMHALDNLTRTLPWQGGYAAMGGIGSRAGRGGARLHEKGRRFGDGSPAHCGTALRRSGRLNPALAVAREQRSHAWDGLYQRPQEILYDAGEPGACLLGG